MSYLDLVQIMRINLSPNDLVQICRFLGISDDVLKETTHFRRIVELGQLMENKLPELALAIKSVRSDLVIPVTFDNRILFSPKGSGGKPLPDASLIEIPLDQSNKRIVNLESENSDPQVKALLERANELTNQVIRLANQNVYKATMENLEKAKELLRTKYDKVEDWPLHLSRAEVLLDRVRAELYREEQAIKLRRIAIETQQADYDRQRIAEQRLDWLIPLVCAFYITLLIVVGVITTRITSNDYVVPLLDVPISVIFWSGLGGVSAMIYRYYKRQQISSVTMETRLLVARPIIGAMVGMLVYKVRSMLLVLSGQDVNVGSQYSIQHDVFLALIWLVSFSDYLFEQVIVKLAGNLTGQDTQEALLSVSKVQQTEIAALEAMAANQKLAELSQLIAENSGKLETEVLGELKELKARLGNDRVGHMASESNLSNRLSNATKSTPEAESSPGLT